ncbi:MAG: cupin domain-containing protein [Methanomicrobiales archaeon]
MGVLRSLAAFILVAVVAVLIWHVGQPFFAAEWATMDEEPATVITWSDIPAATPAPGVTTRTIIHPGRDPVEITFDLSVVAVDPGHTTRPLLLAGTTGTLYILEGSAMVRANQTAVTLAPGDTLVIPPDTVRWITGTDGALRYLSLREPAFDENRRVLRENATNMTFTTPAPELIVVRAGSTPQKTVFDNLALTPLITPETCAAGNVPVPIDFDLSLAEIPPGGGSTPHVLVDTIEIQSVIFGSARVCVDGLTRTVSAGETVIIGPGRVREVRNEGDVPLVYVTVIQPHWTGQREILVPETF